MGRFSTLAQLLSYYRKNILVNYKPEILRKFIETMRILNVDLNVDFKSGDSFGKVGGKFVVLDPSSQLLDPRVGYETLLRYAAVGAYDESVARFSALEGSAYLYSHSFVYLLNSGDDQQYFPIIKLSFRFFTRLQLDNFPKDVVVVTDDVRYRAKEVYVEEKVSFIRDLLVPNSLVIVDGPLIGGDWYVRMIKAIYEDFLPMKTIPIFVVKNSQSDIVIRHYEKAVGRYNSDMHWAFETLNAGERSPIFLYTDINNPRNSRVFAYIKVFKRNPPIRVETHPVIYEKLMEKHFDAILEVVYYLSLVEGNGKNPQPRLVSIAEKYARSALSLVDMERVGRRVGLHPTVNQSRFGW